MTVIATCGHDVSELDDLGIPLSVASYSKDFSRCILDISVCEKCLAKYQGWGVILPDEKTERAWIEGDLKLEKTY